MFLFDQKHQVTMTSDWVLGVIIVEDFLKYAPQIDCDPVGQRLSVESSSKGGKDPSKAQGIIASIFDGRDLGEIKIVRNLAGEAYPYESIDGGHRKRSILAFVGNKFPVHKSFEDPEIAGKYFRQLTKEMQDKFMNYSLRVLMYKTMNNDEKGRAFRNANFSTPVNHQEMLNSYGNTPIANLIRETVRYVPRLSNEVHDLFEHTINPENGEPRYRYVGFANKRLDHDERVARITYLMHIGRLDVCDKAELEALYSKTFDDMDIKILKKKVYACLDFMREIAIIRRRYKGAGLNTVEFTMLYRLYIYLKEMHGDFKLVDAELFFRSFDKAMSRFVGKDEKKLLMKQVRDSESSEPRFMFEAFRGYITVHTSKMKIVKTCEWLLNEAKFDPIREGSIQVRDTKRVFSRAEIEQKLSEQDYKCWVTGKKLTMRDAQGGHIVPHSKGGLTNYDNLVVVASEHNRKMGEMNAYDYRDMWQQENNLIAA